jgi:hypothetical protein
LEYIWEKLGAIVASLVTFLGGLYMYDRKVIHDRLTLVERDVSQNKADIKVIETQFHELKNDTEEIKASQRAIIELLLKKRRVK